MMSLGDEICTYLQGQSLGLNFSGSGTVNLFSSLMPDMPDLAVSVVERGGLSTVMRLTGTPSSTTTYLPPYNESILDRPVFQVFIRSGMTGYTAGNTTVQGVFRALQGLTEVVLNPGGSLFHLIASMQSPMYLGRDIKERHQWSQNFSVMWNNEQRSVDTGTYGTGTYGSGTYGG